MSTKMQRFDLFISQQQRKKLEKESRQSGLALAELIRRKIDADSASGVYHLVDKLRNELKDRFPEECASVDVNSNQEVIGLAVELMERLWRWSR